MTIFFKLGNKCKNFLIHRFRPNKFTVVLGEWDLSDQKKNEHPVVSIQTHPDFEPATSYSDVALLILNNTVTFSEYVQLFFFVSLYFIPTQYICLK